MNNFKERGPTTNSDFFFPIVGCGTGNHLRGDFATSGYVPAMKVKNLENSFYILAICFNNVQKHAAEFEDFFSNLENYEKEYLEI